MILFSIAMVNSLVGDYCGFEPQVKNPTAYSIFYEGILHTYLVGIFPVALVTIINNVVLITRNYSRAEVHNEAIENLKNARTKNGLSDSIVINSQSTANSVEVSLEDLLFIMADGNYVEYHFQHENGSVKREIQRNTLTYIEDQLGEFNFLFRTHRAYLVNLKKIKVSNGNAQGYQLTFEQCDHAVPVSRKKRGDFDHLIANLA